MEENDKEVEGKVLVGGKDSIEDCHDDNKDEKQIGSEDVHFVVRLQGKSSSMT